MKALHRGRHRRSTGENKESVFEATLQGRGKGTQEHSHGDKESSVDEHQQVNSELAFAELTGKARQMKSKEYKPGEREDLNKVAQRESRMRDEGLNVEDLPGTTASRAAKSGKSRDSRRKRAPASLDSAAREVVDSVVRGGAVGPATWGNDLLRRTLTAGSQPDSPVGGGESGRPREAERRGAGKRVGGQGDGPQAAPQAFSSFKTAHSQASTPRSAMSSNASPDPQQRAEARQRERKMRATAEPAQPREPAFTRSMSARSASRSDCSDDGSMFSAESHGCPDLKPSKSDGNLATLSSKSLQAQDATSPRGAGDSDWVKVDVQAQRSARSVPAHHQVALYGGEKRRNRRLSGARVRLHAAKERLLGLGRRGHQPPTASEEPATSSPDPPGSEDAALGASPQITRQRGSPTLEDVMAGVAALPVSQDSLPMSPSVDESQNTARTQTHTHASTSGKSEHDPAGSSRSEDGSGRGDKRTRAGKGGAGTQHNARRATTQAKQAREEGRGPGSSRPSSDAARDAEGAVLPADIYRSNMLCIGCWNIRMEAWDPDVMGGIALSLHQSKASVVALQEVDHGAGRYLQMLMNKRDPLSPTPWRVAVSAKDHCTALGKRLGFLIYSGAFMQTETYEMMLDGRWAEAHKQQPAYAFCVNLTLFSETGGVHHHLVLINVQLSVQTERRMYQSKVLPHLQRIVLEHFGLQKLPQGCVYVMMLGDFRTGDLATVSQLSDVFGNADMMYAHMESLGMQALIMQQGLNNRTLAHLHRYPDMFVPVAHVPAYAATPLFQLHAHEIDAPPRASGWGSWAAWLTGRHRASASGDAAVQAAMQHDAVAQGVDTPGKVESCSSPRLPPNMHRLLVAHLDPSPSHQA